MRRFDFRLLGPLEVAGEEGSLRLGRRQQRAVLALLLLELNHSVSTDRLIESLWPAGPPRRPETAIQGYISALRKLLGWETIETSGGGYCLRAEPESLDAVRFDGLRREGEDALGRGDAAGAARLLGAALELWRGAVLADFAYEAWAQQEIARLAELRLLAQEELNESRLALGEHADVVGELEGLVAEQPLRERPRRQLMLALYRCGRQAEALDVYQQGRALLVEGLGIDPGTELQDLHRAILKQDPSLAAPGQSGPRTNIPAAASSLVGRSDELSDLEALLGRPEVRIVTLTGPGGTGKTRLAVAAASARVEYESDGVWFVDLSALRDPRLVVPTVARTLAGREDVDGVLEGKRLLLVLDNFEQVLDAAVEVALLLSAHPGVRMLVTSREPLRIDGEHQYEVPPLPECDAVALFTERARGLVPSFEGGPAVAEICRRLDGLPLAIQLAAARVKLLPPDAILARLESRLPLLTQGARDLPQRQQTLRSTIAWSVDLLEPEERRAFAELSLFAGGFALEAAEEVAEVDLDTLGSLVDRSLVRVRAGRFALLETIREFALEQLAEQRAGELRARHANFFADLVERAGPELEGPAQAQRLRELDLEHDNIRAALSWAFDAGDFDLALRLVAAAGRFWLLHDHVEEGRQWLERALAQGRPSALRARALRQAGSLAYRAHDLSQAAAWFGESAALARELDDIHALARALGNLGLVHLESGDLDTAVRLFEENRALAREHGWDESFAAATHNLGMAAIGQGDAGRARAYFEQALEVYRVHGDTWSRANSLASLGRALLRLDEVQAGATTVAEALELAREVDESMIIAAALELTAEVAARIGRSEDGALLLGAAAEIWKRGEAQREVQWEAYVAEITDLVQAALDAAAWRRGLEQGRTLDVDSAAAAALDILRPCDTISSAGSFVSPGRTAGGQCLASVPLRDNCSCALATRRGAPRTAPGWGREVARRAGSDQSGAPGSAPTCWSTRATSTTDQYSTIFPSRMRWIAMPSVVVVDRLDVAANERLVVVGGHTGPMPGSPPPRTHLLGRVGDAPKSRAPERARPPRR
jgi:predicted ATPase/DNA-binding SARP family transcriptional activator